MPFPELVPGTIRLSAPPDTRQYRARTTDPPPPSKPARCQPAAPFIWPRSQQDSRWDLRPPSMSARLCPPPGPRSPFHLKKISLGTQTSRRGLQGGQKATLQLSYLCLGSFCLFVFLMRLPWERYCGHRAGRTDPQTWTPNQGRKTELQRGGCFSGPQGWMWPWGRGSLLSQQEAHPLNNTPQRLLNLSVLTPISTDRAWLPAPPLY